MAEQGASPSVSNTTQISAAAHAVTLALLKLNRLIPKALLSILHRYRKRRADVKKELIKEGIIETTAYIAMNQVLLDEMGDEQSMELPRKLEGRMKTQRLESLQRRSLQRQSLFNVHGGLELLDTQEGNHESDQGQSGSHGESNPLTVTKVELRVLNKEHEIRLSELKRSFQAIDRQQRRWSKTYVIPTELFCLVVGLVFWCSLVIGLILGLGDFTRPESFVTAFTIITSVATSEFDYFKRIILARRESSKDLVTEERQQLQETQSAADQGQSGKGAGSTQTISGTHGTAEHGGAGQGPDATQTINEPQSEWEEAGSGQGDGTSMMPSGGGTSLPQPITGTQSTWEGAASGQRADGSQAPISRTLSIQDEMEMLV